MARPRVRTPELRQRFVEEAIDEIESNGVDSVTTRGIALRAESSLAALNEFFGGKAGLLDAAALRGFALLAQRLVSGGAVPEGDPQEELLGACQAHHEFGRRHPRLLALMYSRPFAEFHPSDDDLAAAKEIRRCFTDPVARLVGRRRGDPTVIDLSVGLVSLLEGLTRQEQSGTLGSSGRSTDRRWRRAVDTYLRGLTD